MNNYRYYIPYTRMFTIFYILDYCILDTLCHRYVYGIATLIQARTYSE